MATVDLIYQYFPSISEDQKEKFSKLENLYKEWNSKINVVSRKDIDELYERHVLHSLGIAKVISFKKGAEVLDVGTGGGFPGIPLAILFPEVQFHLVDSIGKKITVVQNVANALGLENVKAEQVRAEQIHKKYDFIVSRAVTRLGTFLGWVKGKVKKEHSHELKNGILYLKGGDLQEELQEAKVKFKVFPLNAHFEEDFFETKAVVYVPMN